MANNVAKREFQKRYLDYWNSTAELTGTGRPVDALIMPLAPFPAAQPEKWAFFAGGYHPANVSKSFYYYGYSMIINLLDYPSVVIPVTHANKDADKPTADHKPLSTSDEYARCKCSFSLCPILKMANAVLHPDDPEIYDGAPVAVQIVGRRLKEERILAIAEYLANLLRDRQQSSAPHSSSHL